MIGDEQCKNEWLLPYIHTKNSSALKFVYLVYDSPMVDNVTVFQFPLGVATYVDSRTDWLRHLTSGLLKRLGFALQLPRVSVTHDA